MYLRNGIVIIFSQFGYFFFDCFLNSHSVKTQVILGNQGRWWILYVRDGRDRKNNNCRTRKFTGSCLEHPANDVMIGMK